LGVFFGKQEIQIAAVTFVGKIYKKCNLTPTFVGTNKFFLFFSLRIKKEGRKIFI